MIIIKRQSLLPKTRNYGRCIHVSFVVHRGFLVLFYSLFFVKIVNQFFSSATRIVGDNNTFHIASVSAAAYVTPEARQRWNEPGYNYQTALKIIKECADRGNPKNKDLFGAVKYIDRFASTIFKTQQEKSNLLDTANGSWELRLALNSDRDQEFYAHPEFRAFAMAFITVDDKYFGKGIAVNPSFSFVALGGPSARNIATRQVYMNYEDFYINGREVPGWDLSYFMRGYERNWVAPERKRPKLAYTVICASDKVLAVRGNKTGGIAIFRKIKDDMRPAAFGTNNVL